MLWFNHRYKRIADSAVKDEAKKLFRVIAKQSNSPVRRVGAYHFYQKLYYEEKILSTFNERYSAAVTEADRRGEKKPSQMVIRQQVVKEYWEKESPEVKKRVEELAEADFERRVAEGEITPPVAPEDFERYVICIFNVLVLIFFSYIETIAPFVGAIAEGLYERTGMLVSIMLAGPIPSDQGRLGVRRYVCHFYSHIHSLVSVVSSSAMVMKTTTGHSGLNSTSQATKLHKPPSLHTRLRFSLPKNVKHVPCARTTALKPPLAHPQPIHRLMLERAQRSTHYGKFRLLPMKRILLPTLPRRPHRPHHPHRPHRPDCHPLPRLLLQKVLSQRRTSFQRMTKK